MLLQVNLVYLLYHLLRTWLNSHYNFPLQSWEDWAEWIFYGDTLNYAFWYLNAYAQSLFILWIVCKKGLSRCMAYLPLLIILGIFCGRYLFLFPFENAALESNLLHYSKNCLSIMLPFMAMGYYYHVLVASLLTWAGFYVAPVQAFIVFGLSLLLSFLLKIVKCFFSSLLEA